jgi:hypothetical protein
MTEKGTLPDGVEYGGEILREYEVREQMVRDVVGVFDDPVRAARAVKNDLFYSTCILAARLTISGLPGDRVTPDLILDLSKDDYEELLSACARLQDRRRLFRIEAGTSPNGSTGNDEARLQS